ncbi:MAG: VOC family protein [Thermoflexales bacterium]|nr:VOC family protein [Thermoflexales bacterium]MCS7325145.1 VOC family protein [Thermoflexales bacterium]MCX7938722.1 VOC family protein [Thermoflexales bacterium]MDW8054456.1 VOC family protein [Anaerolineae bacterium]MDW8292754.1 VOC family protein [Anaerolineae bacterium]
MPVLGISYVTVWSKDLAANRHFFANVLEIPIAYEDENIVAFETGGTLLVLQRAVGADAELDGTLQFGLSVSQMDAIVETLRQNGIQVELDREDLGLEQRVTILRLPSGQRVELVGT